MKVVHIVPELFGSGGTFGGGERYALELSRALARHTPTRLVGFGRCPGRIREAAGLEITTLRNWLPGGRFRTSPAGPGLLPFLAWADVIHCHQTFTMSTSAALLYTRLRRKPIFTTDHAGGGICLQSFCDVEAWFTGHLWVSAFSRGANPRRPGDEVIWGGVDAARFHPSVTAARGGAVLYVGRLIEGKSVHTLVEAVDASLPLDLLGPAYNPEYRERLGALAAGKPVRFLPPSDGPELVAAYQNALCVVLPGVETLGLTLLEAMACGAPVICTTESGLPELVVDGVTGLVVPPNNPAALRQRLQWVRQNPERAAAMGRAARERVCDGFTWDAVAGRCLAAYEAALAIPA